MSPQTAVTYAALGMSLVCFALFVAQSLGFGSARRVEPAKDAVIKAARGLQPVSVSELTDLTKALAALGDSLAKAGPSLGSLIGAILFVAIAAIGSGALVGGPPEAATTTSKKTEAPAAASARVGNTAPAPQKLPKRGEQ